MISITYKYIFLLLLLLLDAQANEMRALLFHGNCITCHKINSSKSAPSIEQVKETYLSAFNNKQDFVAYMSKWVYKPDAQTSLMSQSIKKYSLMPELHYDPQTLEEISKYIYETDFTK